jgi:drug/metabolite transporter (DMT)-like permease
VTAVAAVSTASRIQDFAGLVALVLVLITLFTSQRATTVGDLSTRPNAKKRDATQEFGLLAGLLVVTGLLFIAGLPLFHAALTHWHPRASDGPVRSAFALSWLLLVGLVAWQGWLLVRAFRVREQLPQE